MQRKSSDQASHVVSEKPSDDKSEHSENKRADKGAFDQAENKKRDPKIPRLGSPDKLAEGLRGWLAAADIDIEALRAEDRLDFLDQMIDILALRGGRRLCGPG